MSSLNTRAGNIGVQSGTINLWGVQLEIGSVATPLEKPDPRYDLANCQRFYQLGGVGMYGYASAGSWIGGVVNLPVLMRATPTVTPNSVVYNNASAINVSFACPFYFTWGAPVTALGSASALGNFVASADL
jgi:hypothetical protein